MGPREHEWSDYHAYTLPGIVYTYFLLFLTILFTFQLKTHIGGFTLSDPLAKPCGHRCRPFPPPVSATDAPRVTVSCVVQVVTINQRLITHLNDHSEDRYVRIIPDGCQFLRLVLCLGRVVCSNGRGERFAFQKTTNSRAFL